MASEVKCDIAVIGGGVIGLSCAWRLAQGGAQVALFERGECGREASHAAAGMIAPLVEAARHPPEGGGAGAAMLKLCLQSRDLYPAFAAEFQENIELSLCGHKALKNDWREPGIQYIATESGDAAIEALRRFDECEDNAPHGEYDSVWLSRHGQVHSQKLVNALQNAAEQAGVAIHAFQPVRFREDAKGRVEIATPSHAKIQCETLLLCAGSWSGEIDGLPAQCRPPVRPVAGQMMALRPNGVKLEDVVSRILYSSEVYLVPKLNGQLYVGATMAERGFDKSVEAEGMVRLLQAASKLVPGIEKWEIVAQWAGLRPATPDGLPILGRTPLKNLFVATGHFRNGILLTPVTAQLMAGSILNGNDPPAEFSLARFHQ